MVSIAAAGVPEAPAPVWAETFGSTGNDLVRLGTYANGAYTADPFWLDYAKCNGVIVDYNTSTFGTAECTSTNTQNQNNARLNVRRMADVLGQVNAGVVGGPAATTPVNGSDAATRANRAVAEWTDTDPTSPSGNRVLERQTATGVTAAAPRYYTASLDIVEASCDTTTTRSQITLTLGYGTTVVTGSPITACTDPRAGYYTSPLIGSNTGWVFGGPAVRAGRFISNAAVLVPANQVANMRPVVRNLTNTGGGNDFAIDNLRIIDATPSLDKQFSPATVAAGTSSTLTFTVTNTSELAAKADWSFTDALPSGLVVAAAPAVGGSCGSTTGTAFAAQAAAGASTISVSGGDLAAGAASCTVTVNVVANAPGTYTNGPANVTTVLNAPDSSTLQVEPATTLTIQKNVTGRSAAGDQFRLALVSGTTEVASATTSGSATGIQPQRVGPVNVTRGATYSISENVLSASSLNTYSVAYTCVRAGVTIATGTSISGEITIPNEVGGSIVCTFTNAPQPATLYCDGTYFYAVRANGSIAQVNAASSAAPIQLTGAVTSVVDANALGINNNGSAAFAVDRTAVDTNVASVISYTTSGGVLQATRTVLTAAQGTLQDRNGTALAGTIIAGAVDPLTGRYIVGKSAVGSVRLWEYTPEATSGSEFLYLGQVATGTTTAENGDIAFDAQGNLHILQTAADSSNVGMFSVTRQAFTAATGGTIPASATVRRALSGTDTGNALTGVNGVAFSPRGTVYLGNTTSAYQFDPTTWVRVAGSPRATVGTTATGAGSTDLAACTAPSTISVEKIVVGRLNANDQFRIALSAGSPLAESSVATTTGTASGVQAARIGPAPAQIDTSVTIAETMAAGSVSPLASYNSVYECWADGVRLYTGTAKSATITIPNRLSVGVACTFTNSPQPVATVRVAKFVEEWNGGGRAAAPGWTLTTTATPNTGSTVTSLPSRSPSQLSGADGSATWQVLFGAATHRARLTVSETSQPGYRYQSLVCTVNGATVATTVTTADGQVRGTVNADIAPGNTVVCAFTNRPVATLTLVKSVGYGSAPASDWNLGAAGPTGALPGPSGRAGSPQVVAIPVSAGAAYRLAETRGSALYVQAGAWQCTSSAGQAVAVSASGDVIAPRGEMVTCTVTNATASMTILNHVENAQPGFSAADWLITATPATLAGGTLLTESRVGAEYSTGGNPASTFHVRPGHTYTLSQDLVDPDSPIAYRQVRLERLTGTTWTPVSSTAVPAPPPGQSVVYRFVNAPVTPTTLPVTGGAGADAFLLAGSSTLVLALVLALVHSRHRRRESAL